MATTPAETAKTLEYLTASLKAPRIREAATRIANTARTSHWSYEEYLAAVLEREVAARNASGARLRAPSAHQSGVTRLTCANGYFSGTAGFTVEAPGTSVKATT